MSRIEIFVNLPHDEEGLIRYCIESLGLEPKVENRKNKNV